MAARGETTPAIRALIAIGARVPLTPDFGGWMRYLHASARGAFENGLANPKYRRAALFDERGLIDSVLVVARRRWGKSELLKAIVRHAVEPPNDTQPRGSLVIIDPGNNLAQQVARWPELVGSNRLVYVEPGLRKGYTVGINPLDGTGMDHEQRNAAAIMLAEGLDANAAPLSMNMETLVINCATVLLSLPGSTLRDLLTMLCDPAEDDEAAALLTKARAYPDRDVRDYFTRHFDGTGTRGSKEWLANRLLRLFADNHLASMFGGETSLDLRAAIEGRKAVIINLAPMKVETTIGMAGRLLTATLGGVIRARNPGAGNVAPVLFVIDELTMIAGGKLAGMIAQLGKYGLNLVMGQQVGGAGFSPEDRATILQNTGGRFIGGEDRRLNAELLRLPRDAELLPAIQPRQFWAMWQGQGPMLLNVRSDLADDAKSVPAEEWADYVDKVTDPLSGFYRLDKPTLEPVADRPPASPAHDTAETAPTDVGTLEPGKVAPVEAVKIGLARPPRRNAAKPVDLVAAVGAKRPEPRKRTPAKPLVDPKKTPEVRRTRRKLGDHEPPAGSAPVTD